MLGCVSEWCVLKVTLKECPGHLSRFGFRRERGVKGSGGVGWWRRGESGSESGGGCGGKSECWPTSVSGPWDAADWSFREDGLSHCVVKQLHRRLFPGCVCVCVILFIYPGEDQTFGPG